MLKGGTQCFGVVLTWGIKCYVLAILKGDAKTVQSFKKKGGGARTVSRGGRGRAHNV